MAILRWLCEEFSVAPMQAEGVYELDWYFETKADADLKPGIYDPIYEEKVTSEQIDAFVETFSMFLERLNVRWADGREHAAGKEITAADFNLIAFYTGIVTNPGLIQPQIGERLQSKIESDFPNTKRVIRNIQKHVQKSIDRLPATGTTY